MTHLMDIEVRFSELDPYSHLNHAAYATYFESARVHALREVNLGLTDMADQGFQLVVTQLVIDYKIPAEADDVVTIATNVGEFKRASTIWTQTMSRGDKTLAKAKVTSCVTDSAGKLIRPPEWIFERLTPLLA